MRKFTIYNLQFIIFLFLFYILHSTFYIPVAEATYDPLSVPNNRFGIHIISSDVKESSDAASLVNTNGDWGYVTLLIERKNRDLNRWQTFFNDLRRRHLIPIVRIATEPSGDIWKKPELNEETAWAEFLDKLVWPTKNRYVVIYNEPNHANEWEDQVNPAEYTQVLNKTIDALKTKHPDFFVLNAGLDASTPNKPPNYMDSLTFMRKMDEEIPGIFNKLDGWVSHSYPNPNFSASPDNLGRTSVRGFEWELNILKVEFKVTKDLPVFITETGWKHTDGQSIVRSFISPDKIAEYYKKAFEEAWNSSKIVAVTPFVLNYQQPPFDHFSFKKNGQQDLVHPQFETIKNMPKTAGAPIQEDKFEVQIVQIIKDNLVTSFDSLPDGSFKSSLVLAEEYTVSLVIKNTGQSIWNDRGEVKLLPLSGGEKLAVTPLPIPKDKKVEPGGSLSFDFKVRSQDGGSQPLTLNLISGNNTFPEEPIKLSFEVKSPVVLKIEAGLKWKKDFSGDYILTMFGELRNALSKSILQIGLTADGHSRQIETKYLLPDKEYSFTLEKPFYKPKTIKQRVNSGLNELNFGELQPDITSAILQPQELWKLLPWSD